MPDYNINVDLEGLNRAFNDFDRLRDRVARATSQVGELSAEWLGLGYSIRQSSDGLRRFAAEFRPWSLVAGLAIGEVIFGLVDLRRNLVEGREEVARFNQVANELDVDFNRLVLLANAAQASGLAIGDLAQETEELTNAQRRAIAEAEAFTVALSQDVVNALNAPQAGLIDTAANLRRLLVNQFGPQGFLASLMMDLRVWWNQTVNSWIVDIDAGLRAIGEAMGRYYPEQIEEIRRSPALRQALEGLDEDLSGVLGGGRTGQARALIQQRQQVLSLAAAAAQEALGEQQAQEAISIAIQRQRDLMVEQASEAGTTARSMEDMRSTLTEMLEIQRRLSLDPLQIGIADSIDRFHELHDLLAGYKLELDTLDPGSDVFTEVATAINLTELQIERLQDYFRDLNSTDLEKFERNVVETARTLTENFDFARGDAGRSGGPSGWTGDRHGRVVQDGRRRGHRRAGVGGRGGLP